MLATLPHRLDPAAPGLLDRVRQHRRLQRIDRMGERLARLDAVASLFDRVHIRLEAGWTQDAWFVSLEEDGVQRSVGTLRPERADGSSSACLVGAVAAEAQPGTVTGPVSQRAIGTLWNVLHGGVPATEWSTPPAVTTARAYDLIRWNDAEGRRQSDVLALVGASRAAVSRTATTVRMQLTTA